MTPVSSRSTIRDEISHPTANAKFPLYSKGVERTRFDYGVYLLEKNLEQMLNSQGLSIITLRHILPNLQLFLVSKGKRFVITQRIINIIIIISFHYYNIMFGGIFSNRHVII